ncbi:ATP-binding protein [Pseudomonas sp. N040]|uniref:ATP-binding protein n=1 Tax=Pseudomonas sp. N040 TaxID=2785325 RepID=UPI0018A2A825|nr:ATP-binding protein [Pseudomonas sp. N040]MBF7729374.1 sensor histidine kinase N-terminal domain-containing protein [Pseudomonas sp. N040]MBW7013014.1 sensor histidine kinase N-terminal domain-containing protein [Pseudomonas sp. N040]
MDSIRGRTLLLVLLLLTVTTSLLTYKSYLDAQHEIEELFDARLAQSARLLEGMLLGGVPEATRQMMQQALDQAADGAALEAQGAGHPYESKLSFQVLDQAGAVQLESAQAPQQLLDKLLSQVGRAGPRETARRPEQPLLALAEHLPGFHDVALGEYRWRVFMLHESSKNLWILVGERDDVRGELVAKIVLRSLMTEIFGLPLIAFLVWMAVGVGLRPLRQMAELIRHRDPDSLEPLTLAPLPRELEPMNAALNRLLLQVNHLLGREKRFIADAAHELRTPLAVLRIHAQNALQAPDADDRAAALQQLELGVERATRVVAQLLTMARLEPKAVQMAMADVDLAVFLRSELAELTPLALDRQQELMLELDESANYHVRADAPSLGILLQNLVSNAVQHTPAGGQIQVSLWAETENIWLLVEDSGGGVPEAQREKLFERFYRQGSGQGAGLGLSIVQRIVELHAGEILLADAPTGGLLVRVRLPR